MANYLPKLHWRTAHPRTALLAVVCLIITRYKSLFFIKFLDNAAAFVAGLSTGYRRSHHAKTAGAYRPAVKLQCNHQICIRRKSYDDSCRVELPFYLYLLDLNSTYMHTSRDSVHDG